MADITSESAAGFISESLADLPRNQHSRLIDCRHGGRGVDTAPPVAGQVYGG
jgi:hypothetical protein